MCRQQNSDKYEMCRQRIGQAWDMPAKIRTSMRLWKKIGQVWYVSAKNRTSTRYAATKFGQVRDVPATKFGQVWDIPAKIRTSVRCVGKNSDKHEIMPAKMRQVWDSGKIGQVWVCAGKKLDKYEICRQQNSDKDVTCRQQNPDKHEICRQKESDKYEMCQQKEFGQVWDVWKKFGQVWDMSATKLEQILSAGENFLTQQLWLNVAV
jgi:hypothetical protein